VSKSHRESSPPKAAARRPRQTQARRPKWRFELAIYIGLILAVLAVYAPVVGFEFISMDDPSYVSESSHVRAGLTPESMKWAWTTSVVGNWVPVTMLSHMAVCQWFGLESGAHHGVNALLHALSAVLLLAALRRATGSLWPSTFVAFVFALHPLHVESVAWVSERKDVLSTFFWFAALYAYVRYAERPDLRRYSLVIALFALGLLSKPMLVTFPFTLLLLDVWPLGRTQLPRTLWEKVPLFLLSAACALATYFVQSSAGAMEATRLGENVSNALTSYVIYLGQTFWPTGLAVFYPYRKPLSVWPAAGAFVILAGISALAVFAWRKRPYIATGWFWYLGTLVPVIGVVQVGGQSHADRYMYVPMVGLSMILAWGGADVVRRWPNTKFAVASVAVVACVVCLGVAKAQTAYWRNGETLYGHALVVTKNNFLAQYNLACYLMKIPGRGPEAVAHIEAALRITPDAPDAHSALAEYLLQTGHDAEAITHYEAAVRENPNNAVLHFNLAVAYSKSPAHVSEAVSQYEAALRAKPDFAAAHKNLGLLLLRSGRTADAIAHFETALRIQPDPELAGLLEALRGQLRQAR
jgi:hypothetical protein